MLTRCLVLLVLLITAVNKSAHADPANTPWSSDFFGPGADGDVRVFLNRNHILYVAGDFHAVGRVPAAGIAVHTGAEWLALGTGLDGTVTDLCEWNGLLVAGGEFTAAGDQPVRNVAVWDSVSWQPLGDGPPDAVHDLEIYQGHLYAGGWRWDGMAWVDVLQADDVVRALTVHEGLLVAGGDFVMAGEVLVNHVLAWDGGTVLPMGEGFDQAVHCFGSLDGVLFSGGPMTHSGSTPIGHCARWTGQAWHDVGFSDWLFQSVESFHERDGVLLTVTMWSDFLHGAWHQVEIFDGATWQETLLYSQIQERFYTFADFRDELWLGGRFLYPGPDALRNVALQRDGDWISPAAGGLGVSGLGWTVVDDLHTAGTALFVGGEFSLAGDQEVLGVARLENLAWHETPFLYNEFCSPYPEVLNRVNDFVTFQGTPTSPFNWYDLDILGGGIARYQGGQWFTIDCSFIVSRLGAYGALLVGFYHGANHMWQIQGPQPGTLFSADDDILAAATASFGLLVGGRFSTLDDVSCNRVALWNGAEWQAFGDGLTGAVTCLAADPDANWVLAGERIEPAAAGRENSLRLLDWSGLSWTEIGSGPGEEILCALYDPASDTWFVGGDFQSFGGVPARNVARKTGAEAWQALGSGTDGPVRALAFHEGELYMAGEFQVAGGKAASGLTLWRPNATATVEDRTPVALDLVSVHPNPFNPRTTVSLAIPIAGSTTLSIHDLRGRLVRTLHRGQLAAGLHRFIWDGCDDRGRDASSGTYLFVVEAAGERATQKAVLVR